MQVLAVTQLTILYARFHQGFLIIREDEVLAYHLFTVPVQMIASATARPVTRPEKRQPPRNVPSNAR
jgi:hypothetical protein